MIAQTFFKRIISNSIPNLIRSKLSIIDHKQKLCEYDTRSKLNLKLMYSAALMKEMKVNQNSTKKTAIISLSESQLQQLSNIPSYLVSINYLQKNDIQKSLQCLQYSLTQAKSKFEQSVNLHMCLLNRKSILLKLLSRNEEFLQTLEELFFMSQSLRGLRHLDTHKNLTNYLLALLFYNRNKMSHVLDFVKSLDQMVNNPRLHKKIKDFIFYDALADILNRNSADQAFKKLDNLPEQTFQQKYFKTNNIAWMKYINLQKQQKSESSFSHKIKQQGQVILKMYLRALFDMQSCVPQLLLSKQTQQVPKNMQFLQLLKKYLISSIQQLKFIPDSVKLLNPQSHIITMNVASLLFESQRYQQCVYFMKLSLSTALDLAEVDRVGCCLLLLVKINFKSGQNYQEVLLNILQNVNTYPQHIIKEALILYSKCLFKQMRYIEAEAYANQLLKLEGNLDLQGLLLPDYDFSF